MQKNSDAQHTFKAAFLGPRAENSTEMENLLLDVLRDHVYWRRDFHPEDPRLIREEDRIGPSFAATHAHLRQELFEILARLKNAAPLHSPRQVAHIVSDPSLPAVVGYFAGMLYNQNNVVQEVAPETVRREREYMEALAAMVGYPPFIGEKRDERPDLEPGTDETIPSWGHLSSGGTTANMEALWAVRNLSFFPLAVRLFSKQGSLNTDELHVEYEKTEAKLSECSTAQLLNLKPESVMRLHRQLEERLGRGERNDKELKKQLQGVQKLGLFDFVNEYNKEFERAQRIDRLPVVLISVTSHYCWKKAMDLVGLGSDSLIQVEVDDRIRVSSEDLKAKLLRCEEEGRSVLMVVSVCGTTEEAAVDPLHEIAEIQEESDFPNFWHHCDAALGGYFASMIPTDDENHFIPHEKLDEETRDRVPIEAPVYRAIQALQNTDSVVLDPHKFGYVPYPCGAVLFRDYFIRDFIAYEAPYLAGDEMAGFGSFLGKWTLEGSRPGAAAVSCYLSQAVIPLNRAGHGELIVKCVRSTRELFDTLIEAFGKEHSQLEVRPFNIEPDTTGFCFALVPIHEKVTIEDLNRFTVKVWQTMTVEAGTTRIGDCDFLISKSEVSIQDYPEIVRRMFEATPVELEPELTASEEKLKLLRVFVMNPLLEEWMAESSKKDHPFEKLFSEHVSETAHTLLPEFVLDLFVNRPRSEDETRRLRILIIEDEPEEADSITNLVCFGETFSRYLDAVSVDSPGGALEIERQAWDKVILDLQLRGTIGLDLSGLRVAWRLLEDHDLEPKSIVVYSRFAGIPQVREELNEMGIPDEQIIQKPVTGREKGSEAISKLLLKQLASGVLGKRGE